jgi:hypothetical protein
MTLRTGAIHRPPPPAIQPLHARATLPATTGRDWFRGCPADNNALGNDTIGCCDPAAIFRYIQAALAAVSDSYTPTAADVLARYERIGGYNPADPTTDRGTDTCADLVDFCRNGIPVAAQQRLIVPFWVTVDPHRLDHVAAGLEIAPALVTLQLPTSWELIEQDPAAWMGTPGPLTGECHRVLLGRMDTVRSWGMDIGFSEAFWDGCAVAVDFLIVRDLTPAEGVDWDGLVADAKALAG